MFIYLGIQYRKLKTNELIQFCSFSTHLKSCKKPRASTTATAVWLDSCSDKIPKLHWKTLHMHISKKIYSTWSQTFIGK